MHLLLRETKSLDATEEAVDLGQSPADLVFLSFTDTDLAALSAAHERLCRDLGDQAPTLRIASLQKLRHPGSVDLYLESVAEHAKAIVIRLLGGLDYWRYGAEELGRLAREKGIALAIVPGDGREDQRATTLSTLDQDSCEQIERYWTEGGPANLSRLLRAMAFHGGLSKRAPLPAVPLPKVGYYEPLLGPCCPMDGDPISAPTKGKVLLCFYRSLILAEDTEPIEALMTALRVKGSAVRAIFVNSLKDAESGHWAARVVQSYKPDVVLNTTAFSARREEHNATPLDAAGVPVMQVILSGAPEEAWRSSARGLSAADLAMNVVLPELDGRLMGGVVSFKGERRGDCRQEWPVQGHQSVAEQINLVVEKAQKLISLAHKEPRQRRIALVLSDYPGGGRMAHAVGLDGPASALNILRALKAAGYETGDLPKSPEALVDILKASHQTLSNDSQRNLVDLLPENLQSDILTAWSDDADVVHTTSAFQAVHFGHVVVAIQPDRGSNLGRKAEYHDPNLPPCPAYIAFYQWLTDQFEMDAMIHLGTHGTLEWLPGKANALSAACWPQILSAHVPVFYPFIVNNPGEAAAAKRRIGAAIIGHLTPPLVHATISGPLAELERMVDDFAAAEGLDPRRMRLLQREIVALAKQNGLEEECGLTSDMSDEEAVAQLDAYLCDLKDLQIRDGLHVFGQRPERECAQETARLMAEVAEATPQEVIDHLDASADAEMAALLKGLDGRFIAPGPAGAPSRGRLDVLPTGRNLFTVDPRAVPTRTAFQLGSSAADAFLRRYLQDNGDYPKSVIIDLWGSATMRTGGDEFAQAFAFLGARPVWDHNSNRVSGFEVQPLAELDRPRVDVTLRISGLFRDVFEPQIKLFNELVATLAGLSEPADWNPLTGSSPASEGRIFGAAPGAYGSGLGDYLARGVWSERDELGEAYLAQSGFKYTSHGKVEQAPEDLKLQLAKANAHLQVRDNAEYDVLDRTTYGEFQGGASAAAALSGNALQLYVTDTSRPNQPAARTLSEEVKRVVRGRAANPQWISGQMRHGYAGAAELANTLDALFVEAATTALPFSRQFDLYFDATLGNEDVLNFMMDNNPDAQSAMAERFQDAIDRGLWQPRRNSVLHALASAEKVAAQ